MLTIPGYAQDQSGIDGLESALKGGKFSQVLKELPAVENNIGSSPKLESIRAQALAMSGQYEAALNSIVKYEQMVGNKLDSTHPGHSHMLSLKISTQNNYKAELEAKKEQRVKERTERLRLYENELKKEQLEATEREIAGKKAIDARIKQREKKLTSDETQYLIATKSGATYAKADPRALKLLSFATEPIKPGLDKEEFEIWVMEKVLGYNTKDKILQKIISEYYPVYESDGKGFVFPDPTKTDSNFIQDFAWKTYGAKKASKQRETNYSMARDISLTLNANGLKNFFPRANYCYLEKVSIFKEKVNMVDYTCILPENTHITAQSLSNEVIQMYGEPASQESSNFAANRRGKIISLTYDLGLANLAYVTIHDGKVFDAKNDMPASIKLSLASYYCYGADKKEVIVCE